MACSSIYRDCKAGVILGTGRLINHIKILFIKYDLLGINACYFENLDNVSNWTGVRNPATKQIVINTEWGAFGKVNYLIS